MSCCGERYRFYRVGCVCKRCGCKRECKVKVPCSAVAAEAYLVMDQEYSVVPMNVMFGSVLFNETCPSSQVCDNNGFSHGCCSFYNPTTGVATVPRGGAGRYFIVAQLTTNSTSGSMASIMIDGASVSTKTFGGNDRSSVTLIATKDLNEGQSVSIVVQNNSGMAVLEPSGDNISFRIARIREALC